MTSGAIAYQSTGTITNQGMILTTYGSGVNLYRGGITVSGDGRIYSTNNGSCVHIKTDSDTTGNKRKVVFNTTEYCYAKDALCVDMQEGGTSAMYALTVTKGHFLGSGRLSSYIFELKTGYAYETRTNQSRNFYQIKDYKSYEMVQKTNNYFYFEKGV